MVKDFINKLEGYKTALVELHWTSYGLKQHDLCNDFLEIVCDFQDAISEQLQADKEWKRGTLKPVSVNLSNGRDGFLKFLQEVRKEVEKQYDGVKDEAMKSLFDDFYENTKSYIYQAKNDLRLEECIRQEIKKVIG